MICWLQIIVCRCIQVGVVVWSHWAALTEYIPQSHDFINASPTPQQRSSEHFPYPVRLLLVIDTKCNCKRNACLQTFNHFCLFYFLFFFYLFVYYCLMLITISLYVDNLWNMQLLTRQLILQVTPSAWKTDSKRNTQRMLKVETSVILPSLSLVLMHIHIIYCGIFTFWVTKRI